MQIERKRGSILYIERPLRVAMAVWAIREREHPAWSRQRVTVEAA